MVKEELRRVYRADDEANARTALAEFYETADAAAIDECDRLAKTVRRWEDQVLAYYRSHGLSNAKSEAVNALVKKIKRVGHGFRNLENYRLRLLLHCGGVDWQDQRAARLRKRTPRIAAETHQRAPPSRLLHRRRARRASPSPPDLVQPSTFQSP